MLPEKEQVIPRERIGLNLTRATIAATVKYPHLRSDLADADDPYGKWGAYGGADAERLRTILGVPLGLTTDATFEAQLMDWCDDVTYAVHDVVDFYQSGDIPLEKFFLLQRKRPVSSQSKNRANATRRKATRLTSEAIAFLGEGGRAQRRPRRQGS